MAEVAIFDIDGVISDCTERFRTLYEGKFLPKPEFLITVYDGLDYEPIHLDGSAFRAAVDTSLDQTLYYNTSTGTLHMGDGSTIVRDLPVMSTHMERNPDWQPDWDRFHDKRMDAEPPHMEYVQLARLLHYGKSAVVDLVTARADVYRARTMKYMSKHSVPYRNLWTRHQDHGWENSKFHAIQAILNQGDNIVLAVDDDPKNRALYANHDIPFLYVPRGHHDGEVLADN